MQTTAQTKKIYFFFVFFLLNVNIRYAVPHYTAHSIEQVHLQPLDRYCVIHMLIICLCNQCTYIVDIRCGISSLNFYVDGKYNVIWVNMVIANAVWLERIARSLGRYQWRLQFFFTKIDGPGSMKRFGAFRDVFVFIRQKNRCIVG